MKCSSLTDTEFEEHVNDQDKPFECDHCVGIKIATENNSYFVKLPFPVECEGNIFGKPETKRRPDNSSMTPFQLNKFINECESIEKQISAVENDNSTSFLLQRLTQTITL